MKTAVKTFLASIMVMSIPCLLAFLRFAEEHATKSLGEHLDVLLHTQMDESKL
jgi:hypothetical protein